MNPLKQKLDINNERYRIIVSIKEDYLDGKLSLEEGNRILKEKLGTCTPDEFAYAEQSLKGVYKDEEILEKMDDLLDLFDGVLVRAENEYPENHPLWAYLEEINAVEKVALEADELLKQDNFIKNPWLGVFDSLAEWRTHLSRKQNQLYPMLEDHGFDRPTRIMWTFDDAVRDAISASYALLREDKYEEFLASVPETLAKLRDLNSKELEVLLPTSYKLLNDEEFVRMSKNDHEIGYAIINAPGLYVVPGINDSAAQLNGNNSAQGGAVSNEFLNDLAGLLSKYVGPVGGAPVGKDAVLDVATGKLTLEQINLLFRHLPVDLSYVDENELVKFYSDTAHRIFPRSANVIGREVKNCHPAKSVHIVEEIVEKFRSGEQSQAEFWINKPGLFIYVIYTAVRDENGKFRGVLEMMQDCTHIRELEGSRTLLTWDKTDFVGDGGKEKSLAQEAAEEVEEEPLTTDANGRFHIDAKTTLSNLIKQCPDIVDYLISLNPKFEKLKTPMVKVMAKVATIKMIAERGDFEVDDLISKIDAFINKDKK
ncbi:PAS domain-containing protein [Veillonella parvula]|uniref:PAS domain-containing protein n=1 Tax=Veillonella parvula TaxID=29466 RepID=UPI001D097DD7|nr:PAS domain-containing protein [Veillonella parvula]MCB7451851.1 PAS domain-containing protein [Veillonella parvula]MCQ4956340.1 PAS domain-containing protein [Veillonella parvula]MCQ4977567.1 PAS domain-containing protein [Veillonella parvula]